MDQSSGQVVNGSRIYESADGELDFISEDDVGSRSGRWSPFDDMSAEWISVYNGLSWCRFAALLLIGTMFLTATCMASPGKGRTLPVLIPILAFLVPLLLDLVGRFDCTGLPDDVGRRYAIRAFGFGIGFIVAWIAGALVRRAELSTSAYVPLVGLMLELGTFVASAVYWLRYLSVLSNLLRSSGLRAKVASFSTHCFGGFALIFLLIVVGMIIALFAGDEAPLNLAGLLSSLAAIYLLIRHRQLLSVACDHVKWRAPRDEAPGEGISIEPEQVQIDPEGHASPLPLPLPQETDEKPSTPPLSLD